MSYCSAELSVSGKEKCFSVQLVVELSAAGKEQCFSVQLLLELSAWQSSAAHCSSLVCKRILFPRKCFCLERKKEEVKLSFKL